jgi:hypothetical protein
MAGMLTMAISQIRNKSNHLQAIHPKIWTKMKKILYLKWREKKQTYPMVHHNKFVNCMNFYEKIKVLILSSNRKIFKSLKL